MFPDASARRNEGESRKAESVGSRRTEQEAGKWEREDRRGSKVERRGRESGGKNQ